MLKIAYYNRPLATKIAKRPGVAVEKLTGGSTRAFGLSVFSEFTAGTASLMLVTGPEEEIADVPFLYMKQDVDDKEWVNSRGGNYYNNKLKDKLNDNANKSAPFLKFFERLLPLKTNVHNLARLVVAKRIADKFDDVEPPLTILATYSDLYAIVESDDNWKAVAVKFKVLLVKSANKEKWYLKRRWRDDFKDNDAADKLSPQDYDAIQKELSTERQDMDLRYNEPYPVPKDGKADRPENWRYPKSATGNVYTDHDPASKTDEFDMERYK